MIGVVIDRESGEVVNVNKMGVMEAIVKVEEIEGMIDFNIYPNPVSNVVNIELGFDSSEEVEIYLSDNMGRKVASIFITISRSCCSLLRNDTSHSVPST